MEAVFFSDVINSRLGQVITPRGLGVSGFDILCFVKDFSYRELLNCYSRCLGYVEHEGLACFASSW